MEGASLHSHELSRVSRYMATKIVLFNHKGGVGKTTVAVNLARAFGQLGLQTLISDCDPQCNATAFYLTEKQPGARKHSQRMISMKMLRGV